MDSEENKQRRKKFIFRKSINLDIKLAVLLDKQSILFHKIILEFFLYDDGGSLSYKTFSKRARFRYSNGRYNAALRDLVKAGLLIEKDNKGAKREFEPTKKLLKIFDEVGDLMIIRY